MISVHPREKGLPILAASGRCKTNRIVGHAFERRSLSSRCGIWKLILALRSETTQVPSVPATFRRSPRVLSRQTSRVFRKSCTSVFTNSWESVWQYSSREFFPLRAFFATSLALSVYSRAFEQMNGTQTELAAFFWLSTVYRTPRAFNCVSRKHPFGEQSNIEWKREIWRFFCIQTFIIKFIREDFCMFNWRRNVWCSKMTS